MRKYPELNDRIHMINLIYVSTATRQMSNADLDSLLIQSRDRNAEKNITGMLLYSGGNFIQALEGSESDVEAIYASIERDPRNTSNIIIVRSPIQERNFPQWSMGFRRLDKMTETPEAYSDFMQAYSKDRTAINPGLALNLLDGFRKNNA